MTSTSHLISLLALVVLLLKDNTVDNHLKSVIEKAALPKQMPDGSLEPTLTVAQIEELAVRFGTNGKSIEITALEGGILPERYIRNFNTYQPQDQIQLLRSRVTVVGLGGLGGSVVEWLSRSGIGSLNLVDGDRFEDHNLNRQLLSSQQTMDSPKAGAAAERVCSINSSITVEAYEVFIDQKNLDQLIKESDVVVDCLDNIESRFVLETAAKKAGLPMVSAAVAGLSGQVTTIFSDDVGLELIYGSIDRRSSNQGVEKVLGCLPQSVGLIAAAQSNEIINLLLGRLDNLLRNRMLLVDMDTHTYEVVDLK